MLEMDLGRVKTPVSKEGQMCTDFSVFKIHPNTQAPGWQEVAALLTCHARLCARNRELPPFLEGLCGH